MPVNNTASSALPIGVDFGTSSLKMAQLCPVEGGYALVASAVSDVPAPCRGKERLRFRFLSETLTDLLANGRFQGKECILSLPAEETFVQSVRLPRSAKAQMDFAIQGELADKLPFPVGQAIVRHVVAGEVYEGGEAKQEAIVVAASKARVEKYLALARKARLEPVGVDVEPFAIVECFARLFDAEEAAGPVLFVDIGEVTTQVVLARGTQVLFARNLQTGGELLAQTLADARKVSPSQAREMRLASLRAGAEQGKEIRALLEKPISELSGELTQCLRYCESVFKSQSVERAVFVGGQAYDRELCQAIARRMNIPAQIGDPLVRVAEADASAGPQPRLAVAVGLSLGSQLAA
ncbi:MAG: pilus assembly protein PilM [Phycisphaerae bacterium]